MKHQNERGWNFAEQPDSQSRHGHDIHRQQHYKISFMLFMVCSLDCILDNLKSWIVRNFPISVLVVT